MKKTLEKIFSHAKVKGIKFNLAKSKFNQQSVKFLGHVFSKDGIAIDEGRIDAILKMEKPKDKKSVERLLGVITYCIKYIPNASNITAPLRELIKNEVKFNWTKEHDEAIEQIKKALTNAPVLQYYDPNLPCKSSVDANQSGLGAVLLQNNYPVAYASKAFTNTQEAWAQIEKELYAVVFGCERFKQYV